MKIIIDTNKDTYDDWKHAEHLIEEMYQKYRRLQDKPVDIPV